jgi:hypothetical protein
MYLRQYSQTNNTSTLYSARYGEKYHASTSQPPIMILLIFLTLVISSWDLQIHASFLQSNEIQRQALWARGYADASLDQQFLTVSSHKFRARTCPTRSTHRDADRGFRSGRSTPPHWSCVSLDTLLFRPKVFRCHPSTQPDIDRLFQASLMGQQPRFQASLMGQRPAW